jgi:hypothetical protein
MSTTEWQVIRSARMVSADDLLPRNRRRPAHVNMPHGLTVSQEGVPYLLCRSTLLHTDEVLKCSRKCNRSTPLPRPTTRSCAPLTCIDAAKLVFDWLFTAHAAGGGVSCMFCCGPATRPYRVGKYRLQAVDKILWRAACQVRFHGLL